MNKKQLIYLLSISFFVIICGCVGGIVFGSPAHPTIYTALYPVYPGIVFFEIYLRNCMFPNEKINFFTRYCQSDSKGFHKYCDIVTIMSLVLGLVLWYFIGY
jgi:hypothetical protein